MYDAYTISQNGKIRNQVHQCGNLFPSLFLTPLQRHYETNITVTEFISKTPPRFQQGKLESVTLRLSDGSSMCAVCCSFKRCVILRGRV